MHIVAAYVRLIFIIAQTAAALDLVGGCRVQAAETE
jgi:hypothetical protein